MKTKTLLLAVALLWLAPTATAQTVQIKAAPSMAPNSPPLKDRQIGIARDTKYLWIGLTNATGTATENWCLNLVGPTGPQGPAGQPGASVTGPKGDKGETGATDASNRRNVRGIAIPAIALGTAMAAGVSTPSVRDR